jgi:hypothetical protein
VRFFFPDSQDQIDPSFDFDTEEASALRVRQRDDRYAHEVLAPSPYLGLLVSKAMIDRFGGAGRYSAPQRQRFYRVGVREFFRLDAVEGERIETLGDCGAFSYVNEPEPPYSVDEVIDFYEQTGFDGGLSVDHVIPAFDSDAQLALVDSPWKGRFELTLELAAAFLTQHRARRCKFQPIGVAQGWSTASYAKAVDQLQKIGYRRIALGGLVPLKSPDILATLEAVDAVRASKTELHLLGVTRCEHVAAFRRFGVTSFDSTSPFRQAFKDERDNYFTLDRTFIALRVPQVEGNPRLQDRIRAGEIKQELARGLEQDARESLAAFDRGEADLETALSALSAYERLHDGKRDRRELYREVLEAAPWRECECEICQDVGIQVMLFRGTERNKRRGFHNLYVFAKRVARELRRSRRKELAVA